MVKFLNARIVHSVSLDAVKILCYIVSKYIALLSGRFSVALVTLWVGQSDEAVFFYFSHSHFKIAHWMVFS